jgi:glutamyl/glutaminyl-tRNA synthetase
MSFKEFDLSEYIDALENFKKNSVDDIVKHWGSVDNFDLFIQKIKDDESEVAKLAIKQFGSIEKYTEAMKYNLEHFSDIMDKQLSGDTKKIMQQSDDLYSKLTSDMTKDISSDEVQHIVKEIDSFMQENTTAESTGKDYWNMLIDTYSRDFIKRITDTKYGVGASAYIVQAFRFYSNNNQQGY